MKNRFLVLGLAVVGCLTWGLGMAKACENQPKLEIQNKGEANERWVLSPDLSDPSCKTIKKLTWSYDLWNYQGQGLVSAKEKKMAGDEELILNHGDRISITASLYSPVVNTGTSESGNPCSNLPPGVLGCSTDGGKSFYSYDNKASRDTYGADSVEEFTNTYIYYFMPYSDFPLEATVECNNSTPRVHLYWIDFETNATRIANGAKNNFLLPQVFAVSDGNSYEFTLYRGNGEQYEAENCRDNLPYHCVKPLANNEIYYRNTDWDYENPVGTLDKYGYNQFLDSDVVNNQYYHYFANYGGSSGSYSDMQADSNFLTVYVNCPNLQ